MKISKFVSGVFGVLTAAAVAATIAVASYALDASPKLLQAPRDASEKVVHLMEAVGQGDYAAASGCMLGNPSLGVDRDPDSAAGQKVWDAFTDSFTYTLEGGLYATDSGLAQDVTVSFLELGSVTTDLQERAQELLNQRVKDAKNNSEVYNEKFEYRDDVIAEVLGQVIDEALEQRANTVTAKLSLNLKYQNGQWWVVPAGDLLNAISGNILY